MEIRTLILLVVSGVLFFLVTANIIIPFFGSTYEYGGLGIEPCNKQNACQGISASSTNIRNPYCLTNSSEIACATCPNSTGYGTFLSSCFALITNGSAETLTRCWSCGSFAGYKISMQGMMLFTFFIIIAAVIIIIAIKYLPKFA